MPERTTYRYNAGSQLVALLDTEGGQTYALGSPDDDEQGEELMKPFIFSAANQITDGGQTIREVVEKKQEI